MAEIQKLKKYLFKFPEGTTTEAQKEYLGQMKEALKEDDWVVINPGIEVYEAHEATEEPKPDVPATPEGDAPTDTPAEPAKPAETPAEPAKPVETPKADDVKVTTVTSEAPAEEAKPKPAFPADENATAQ